MYIYIYICAHICVCTYYIYIYIYTCIYPRPLASRYGVMKGALQREYLQYGSAACPRRDSAAESGGQFQRELMGVPRNGGS